MSSRIRENPAHVFACFCEVVIPNENEKKPWILQKYPEDFNDQEILKCVPQFSCPCEFTNAAVQHFSFVLTSLDSKWTFGYCRHASNSPTLFVLISFLPWHETFYKILNQIADLTNSKETHLLTKFLESVYSSPVPEPGFNLHVSYDTKEFIVYCPNHLKLPGIPENRNLTEYFNAIDAHNMMVIFASMLHERRILITSKKLSRLSACVQAANSLIYPMHWQHIFIPVLPKHLLDYISAPMPFLIGVPSITIMQFRESELSEVVILDADNNRVKTPFKDLETLPPEIVSSLKRSLKNPNMMLGDGVSRSFMRALVQLIGGYRDSLKFTLGQKITFDADAFIQTRSASVQPFLETMLHLQIFQQFIEDRLDMLNSGTGFSDEFEYEVNLYEVHSSNNLKSQYKEWVTTMKKEGGAFLKNVKSKTNPAVKYAYKSVKDKGKRAYKDLRSKIQDIQKHPSQSDMRFDQKFGKPKSAPSSPTMQHPHRYGSKRISYNQNDTSRNGVLDAMNLPNSISVSGIRRYKILTVDEITEEAVFDGGHSPNIQRLDIDLMGELRDVIYRRCSVSSDNLNSLGLENVASDLKSKETTGFTDSFCDSNDVFLPAPIPPPRIKKNLKPVQRAQTTELLLPEGNADVPEEKALIQFESLDDVALFDPLKANNAKDTELLPFITSKPPATDIRVTELKNAIQNLTSTPVHHVGNQAVPYFSNAYFPPGVATSSLLMPGFPQQSILSNSQSTPLDVLNNKSQDERPALPPKTRASASTFFVGTSELTKADQDLLDDYGIGSSPIFSQNSKGKSKLPSDVDWTITSRDDTNSNSLAPSNVIGGQKPMSPRNRHKDFKVQSSWQKFA